MTGPHLIEPFTEAERLVAEGVRAGKKYEEIAVDLTARFRRGKPVQARTVRSHVLNMAGKIAGLPDDFHDFAPRYRLKLFLGLSEWEDRFYKSA